MGVFMKISLAFFTLTLLYAFLLSGCSYYSTNIPGSILGINIQDLEKARANGVTATYPLPYATAFNKVTDILKANKLTIYESNRNKKYIVAMGFHKQVDTTRVGIFFAVDGENSTKITLSSLSNTTLPKAENIIFGGLEKSK